MNETELVFAIRRALEVNRIWCVRVNTGQFGRVRFGIGNGGPDLFALHDGTAIALEVKSPANKSQTGRQSDAQRAWADRWQSAGGRYAVVRSVEEALAALTP